MPYDVNVTADWFHSMVERQLQYLMMDAFSRISEHEIFRPPWDKQQQPQAAGQLCVKVSTNIQIPFGIIHDISIVRYFLVFHTVT